MRVLSIVALLFIWTTAIAKVDLVTLPQRDRVQLTVYNAADLTLVREQRILTLKQGMNQLQFSWENTLIDPTSVQLRAPQHGDQVRLLEVLYPPNAKDAAIWQVESKISGEIPVEISFFTSGISWQASYQGTLSADGQSLHLQNAVRITNHSGEDYADARTRVVVGNVQLLDNIAMLARRQPPYGHPQPHSPPALRAGHLMRDSMVMEEAEAVDIPRAQATMAAMKPKEIVKEGVSEYFLYSIAGTETIPNGWGKSLPSLDVREIPIKTLYRYDEQRYHRLPHYFLTFRNDQDHKLGETPLPDGGFVMYQQIDQGLRYIGQTTAEYIPLQQDVELDFGASQQVAVTPVLMDYQTENYSFSRKGQISGHDRIERWQIQLHNRSDQAAEIEIFRHTAHPHWTLETSTAYEKIDLDTFRFTITLPPRARQTIDYSLTLYEGDRRQGR